MPKPSLPAHEPYQRDGGRLREKRLPPPRTLRGTVHLDLYVEPLEPSGYWRDEHPLGCTGLKRYGVAGALEALQSNQEIIAKSL